MTLLKKTMLVVEDSPSQAVIVQFMLEQNEYQVLWAPNGKIGVLMAEEYLPDVIVMDAEMPEMNGFEACKLLKDNKYTANIPIIMMTARSETDHVSKGMELGVSDFIPKDPFSTMVLLGSVRALLK